MIPFIPFFLLVSILPFHTTASLLNNIRLRVNCTGSNYAVNSTYQTNLNTLLSSLAAKSSFSLYNKATIGASANQVYGLYACQGDLSLADCQTCVQSAAADITATESCPSSRQAIIWYDYCMLRYSDANFFGVPNSNGFILKNGDKSSTSPLPYQMVSNLVHVAPFRQPMFASNASTTTSSYVSAQCTDDLTQDGCTQCLNTILSSIKDCCLTSVGWRYTAVSCSIRFQFHQQHATVHHQQPSRNPDGIHQLSDAADGSSVRIFVDAACTGTLCTYGILVYDVVYNNLASITGYDHLSSPLEAEILAILSALRYLSTQCYTSVQLFSDYKQAVSYLHARPSSWPWRSTALLTKCLQLWADNSSVSIRHIPRTLNSNANNLAREAKRTAPVTEEWNFPPV